MRDVLANRELRGPRSITSSNIDRIFDDNGKRTLFIEEKNEGEAIADGHKRLLRAMATKQGFTVWLVRGDPNRLRVDRLTAESTLQFVAGGDLSAYQAAVTEWYASPEVDPPGWLDVLAEAPFTAPAGFDPALWHAFDVALTRLNNAGDARQIAAGHGQTP